MFTPLRRCPTSIRWRIVSTTAARSNALPLSSGSRSATLPTASSFRPSTIRTLFSSSTPTRRAQESYPADAEEVEQNAAKQPASESAEPEELAASGLMTKFADLDGAGLVDSVVVRTLTKKMGLETMTEVQSRTLNEALKGKDVLAQAKTGTGKTVGFLLPVLQRILTEDPSLLKKATRPPRYGQRASDVRAIIISPTRELAEQIAAEATKLTQDTGVVIQTAVGGTQKSLHLRAMQREGCHILVGTPGRLKDIFSDRETGVSAPMLSAFVLDEADRLLDAGFWPEIQAIQDLLPSKSERDRQTLMFSATVSQDVVKLVRSVMKPDLHYVRTVQENETPTHDRVKQSLVTVSSLENQLPTVLELCQRQLDAPATPETRPFKAIVYFNSTAEVTLASQIFMGIRRGASTSTAAAKFEGSHLSNTRVYEIHSRLSQKQRTIAAEQFRHCTSGILMSSDVTARGMDFPGVTHVIQVGLAVDRETYIHRLGRTARAGQEGEGWLIVPAPFLNEMRQRLGRLPIERDTSLAASQVDMTSQVAGSEATGLTPAAQEWYDAVSSAAKRAVDQEDTQSTYLALLGTHQWVKDKEWLVGAMNRLSSVQWGMSEPPSVSRGLAVKMRMLGLPGLRVGGGARGGNESFAGRARSFSEAEGRPGRGRFGDRDERGVGRSGGGGGYGDRGERSERSFGDRQERGGGGGRSYGDREERRPRTFTDRNDRGSGGSRGGFSNGARGRTSDRGRGGGGGSGRSEGDRGRNRQRDDY